MIYNISDKVPFKKLILFGIQMVLSVITASILIANICHVDVGAALIGPGISTIVYLLITKFKSPMVLSNSGAFVSPVLTALCCTGATWITDEITNTSYWSTTPNYFAVFIGSIVSCFVYCIFGLIFTKVNVDKIYSIFPKALIGAVTVVIGINLMGFIPTYVTPLHVDASGMWEISCAIVTMIAIALFSHYANGLLKLLPFLLGTLVGYLYATILTVTGIYEVINFKIFTDIELFSIPEFAFTQWNTSMSLSQILSIVIVYVAFTISAMMECLSDHAALGGIINVDLYKTPGLSKIFIAEGVANLTSASIGSLGSCSYGEGVATVGASKAASTRITFTAALMLIALGFIGPVQAFISSIPDCTFAGTAVILYGFIAASGVKMLQKTNLDNQKNLIIVSSVLSIGIAGIAVTFGSFSLSGTALALVVGVILNLILKDKNE